MNGVNPFLDEDPSARQCGNEPGQQNVQEIRQVRRRVALERLLSIQAKVAFGSNFACRCDVRVAATPSHSQSLGGAEPPPLVRRRGLRRPSDPHTGHAAHNLAVLSTSRLISISSARHARAVSRLILTDRTARHQASRALPIHTIPASSAVDSSIAVQSRSPRPFASPVSNRACGRSAIGMGTGTASAASRTKRTSFIPSSSLSCPLQRQRRARTLTGFLGQKVEARYAFRRIVPKTGWFIMLASAAISSIGKRSVSLLPLLSYAG